MKQKKWFFLGLILMLAACGSLETKVWEGPAPGDFRAVLWLSGGQLPFDLLLNYDENWSGKIVNREQEIRLDSVKVWSDSVGIWFPNTNNFIQAVCVNPDSLEGFLHRTDNSDSAKLRFSAGRSTLRRFPMPVDTPMHGVMGKWRMEFTAADGSQRPGLARLKQTGTDVFGTIQTLDGEYANLVGSLTEDSLFLSTFDGKKAFLFKSGPDPEDEWFKMRGHFRSLDGESFSFSAVRDEEFALGDSE